MFRLFSYSTALLLLAGCSDASCAGILVTGGSASLQINDGAAQAQTPDAGQPDTFAPDTAEPDSGPAGPPAGAAAIWRFNSGEMEDGDTFTDLSGNAAHADVYGSPTIGAGGMTLDGTDDYVDVPGLDNHELFEDAPHTAVFLMDLTDKADSTYQTFASWTYDGQDVRVAQMYKMAESDCNAGTDCLWAMYATPGAKRDQWEGNDSVTFGSDVCYVFETSGADPDNGVISARFLTTSKTMTQTRSDNHSGAPWGGSDCFVNLFRHRSATVGGTHCDQNLLQHFMKGTAIGAAWYGSTLSNQDISDLCDYLAE